MIGTIAVAWLLLGHIAHWIQSLTTETWTTAGSTIHLDPADITHQIQNTIGAMLKAILPIMGLFVLIGIGSHWIQTGPLFLSKKITPDVTRLGPATWKRQFFSLGNLAFLIVGIPKILIAVVVLAASSWANRNEFFALANLPSDVLVKSMFNLILTVSVHVAAALLVASIADYGMKWTSYQRRIKMTDQQLRDELRMQNGGR